MTKSNIRLFGALGVITVAVVAVIGIVAGAGGDGDSVPVAIGGEGATAESSRQPAPPIAGEDPITGDPVALVEYAGQPVVLNFWASWCGPCRAELPALQELSEAHPEAQVVGVNFMDSPSDARALQEEIGFTFPSVADPGGNWFGQMGVKGMPTTFFLDEQHRVVGLVAGGTDLEGFEQGLSLAAGS
ncbi:MAG: TlpA family protein disulfide reductase [Gaiellales bacterium]